MKIFYGMKLCAKIIGGKVEGGWLCVQLNISSPEFSQEPVVKDVVRYFEKSTSYLDLEDTLLYYRFPIFKNFDDSIIRPTLLLVDSSFGLILIDCDDHTNRLLTEKALDSKLDEIGQVSSQLISRLIKYPNLRVKRRPDRLICSVTQVLFAPNLEHLPALEENICIVNHLEGLTEILKDARQNQGTPLPNNTLREIYSVLDGSRALPKPKIRSESLPNNKAWLLENLEQEIATFDQKQRLAALALVDGPQRVRGLAGSGKTVILAMKASLIHLQDPNAKILLSFNTKSLYEYIKRLVTRFYRMSEDHDPDWNKIHIRHAWGGTSLPGVYYDACTLAGIKPLKFSDISGTRHQFDAACRSLLDQTGGNLIDTYDYVLIDEAQDFLPSFYWLCRKIVKEDRLTWAYDELQDILDVQVQDPMQLFKNSYGDDGIDLTKLQEKYPYQSNDIVLNKCYRNPREILIVAHAIGFGIYNENILQMLENKEHWIDLGYQVDVGNCISGENTIVSRPKENSPLSISNQQSIDEIIKWYVAEEMEDEVAWVARSIKDDIESGLLPEDVLVICVDDKYARTYFSEISNGLDEFGIASNNLLLSYSGDKFGVDNHVTMSTVYRAKGNEAAIVYVVGTDTFALGNNDIIERNKIFTAFTRAKGWLRISGMGKRTEVLIKEVKEAIEHFPRLEFLYPDMNVIRTLRRRLSEETQSKQRALENIRVILEKEGIDFSEAVNLLEVVNKSSRGMKK